jgi:aryl-alcohol dehydrogenase-like predicted oxidoreductase
MIETAVWRPSWACQWPSASPSLSLPFSFAPLQMSWPPMSAPTIRTAPAVAPDAGRAAGMLLSPQVAPAVAAGREMAALVRETGRDPASLAMAFALLNPSVTAVLFGATNPGQVKANLAALSVAENLSPAGRRRLMAVGRTPDGP